jgi:superfamily I DNA/RNA helicase
METKREWSTYQQAVFADFEDDKGHTVIEAGPGSGKTTTVIEGTDYIPGGRRTVISAFNRSIQKELAERAPRGVEAKTFHGIGRSVVTRAFGDIEVVEDKAKLIADEVLIDAGRSYVDRFGKRRGDGSAKVAKLVGLGKNTLLEETDLEALEELACQFGLDEDEKKFPVAQLAKFAGEVMTRSAEDKSRIDFDDMIWFPARHRSASYDVVVADEVQDMNAAQLYLVQSLIKRNGRIVAVGDPWQAIYAFRGADEGAMDRIKAELGAKVLKLSISYRCAKSIVDLARSLGAPIEAAPNAEKGSVEFVADDYLYGANGPKPGDFVLSRANAPLLSGALNFLARGIPAVVAGRDVGRQLAARIEATKTSDVAQMLADVQEWAAGEVKKAEALDKPKRGEAANDVLACIVALASGKRSVAEVLAAIETLFRDDDLRSRVVFSSVHKAKGLERDNVFLIGPTFRPAQNNEERNIYYVAITRAKKRLVVCGALNTKARG